MSAVSSSSGLGHVEAPVREDDGARAAFSSCRTLPGQA